MSRTVPNVVPEPARQNSRGREARSEVTPPYGSKRQPEKQTTDDDERVILQAISILRGRLQAREVFASPDAVKTYLQLQAQGLQHEVFGLMYLDAQNRLIHYEQLFRGSLTQTSVYPREILIQALGHHAAAVILHHNHPSGVCTPSRADEALTVTLKSALALVDIRVLDHIITCDGGALSMAECGLL